MTTGFQHSPIAMAALAAIASLAFTATAEAQPRPPKAPGKYVAGDFHNHSTCSDGSISMQKLVKKSTDKTDTPWGLDWFVQAGHGGQGNRNCTLAEDETLATPAYPLVFSTWWCAARPDDDLAEHQPRHQSAGAMCPAPRPTRTCGAGSRCSRSSIRCSSTSRATRTSRCSSASSRSSPATSTRRCRSSPARCRSCRSRRPSALARASPPARTPPSGNANALAQWEYCFDRNDTDTSRGNTSATSGVGNNWNCSVPGSLNAADPSWSALAQKLIPAGGTGTGNRGHNKTLEAVKWMKEFHGEGSYYVPAHLERAGPFNPNGNNGFNIEHLRNFNNAAPRVAFGFESQPGHGASVGPRRVRDPPQQHRRRERRLRRRHHLRRHGHLRRAGRRRLGCAARRRPQLVVLRQLRLAQPRQLRPGRPPQHPGLLPRRIPAQLHDGAQHDEQADAAADRRRPAHRQQLRHQRPVDRPPGLRRLRRHIPRPTASRSDRLAVAGAWRSRRR